MRQLSLLYTGNQHCYSVRYSPSDNSTIACVSCDKFGLSGSASLYIIRYEERAFLESKFSVIESFRLTKSMFDVDWSPIDPSLLVTANGDGSVALWKWPALDNLDRKPVHMLRQHNKEVYSVRWEPSGMRSYHVLSASWDGTIKIWNVSDAGLTSLTSLTGHQSMVYSAAWNHKQSGYVLSTSADKTFRLWDVNQSSISSAPLYVSPAHGSDILCCDWSRFEPNQFALGFASGLVEICDMRNLKAPLVRSIDMAHAYAVRQIKYSPHVAGVFGTVSYDMRTKLWSANTGACLDEDKNHSEFTYGFDFDSKAPNRVVDCGWDRRVVLSEFDISGMAVN